MEWPRWTMWSSMGSTLEAGGRREGGPPYGGGTRWDNKDNKCRSAAGKNKREIIKKYSGGEASHRGRGEFASPAPPRCGQHQTRLPIDDIGSSSESVHPPCGTLGGHDANRQRRVCHDLYWRKERIPFPPLKEVGSNTPTRRLRQLSLAAARLHVYPPTPLSDRGGHRRLPSTRRRSVTFLYQWGECAPVRSPRSGQHQSHYTTSAALFGRCPPASVHPPPPPPPQ